MSTLELNQYTYAWREIGSKLAGPRALLVALAHWYIGATAVTVMPKPRMIHDFYGSPPQLFAFQYPALEAPDIAAVIAETVRLALAGPDVNHRGLGHGIWSVLAHRYPAADVPVLHLSINALNPLDFHLELAARLTPPRDNGVLVVVSSDIAHNLHLMDQANADWPPNWLEVSGA